MSSSGLDHSLVREYLRELDVALSPLPGDRATELREQITAHLDEMLSPGADDSEVAAALSRLGAPADLAAEAGADNSDASSPAQPAATFASLARTRLARMRKRTLVLAAAAVIVLGSGVGYLVSYVAVGNLQFAGNGLWWYLKDAAHAQYTMADGAQQTTVPIRSGQRQGFAVGIYNPTGWTQTIVGAAANEGSPGSGAGSVQLGVSVFNLSIDRGGSSRDVRFTLPGSIAPGQIRLLRVTWISDSCLPAGGDQGIDELNLRVRVGWITRTETIPLDMGWYLAGPSHGRCV